MQPFDLAADHAQWRSNRRLFSGRGTDSIGEIIRRRPREFTETRNQVQTGTAERNHFPALADYPRYR